MFTHAGNLIRTCKNRTIMDEVLRIANLKVPGDRNHILRHTYARVYLEKYEGRLEELSRFLGHKSISLTQAYYGHYSEDAAIDHANRRVYPARSVAER